MTPFRFQTTQKNPAYASFFCTAVWKLNDVITMLYYWTMHASLCFNCLSKNRCKLRHQWTQKHVFQLQSDRYFLKFLSNRMDCIQLLTHFSTMFRVSGTPYVGVKWDIIVSWLFKHSNANIFNGHEIRSILSASCLARQNFFCKILSCLLLLTKWS